MRHAGRSVIAAVVAAAFLCGCVRSSATAGPAGTDADAHATVAPASTDDVVTVVRVVDGDTITVRRGQRNSTVRLLGIDTPETHRPDTPVECFGPEAHEQLGRLLPVGTEVRLEHDAEHTDRYQRELAYVRRASDGLFVNEAMARDGFAGALTYKPNTRHAAELEGAADEARLAHRGLWSACGSNHRPA